MNLHLGCGNLKLPNFINIDINSDKADIKLDITNLSIFNNDMVDQIYNCHVLEHIQRDKLLAILIEWNRILKIGGTLRIAVPDFEKVVKIYGETNDLTLLIGFLNGGQKTIWDFHYINFDYKILTEILSLCGFDNFQRYDPHEFLGDKDDYSKSYLPHMNINGTLMSLNIVCVKKVNVNTVEIPPHIKKFLRC